MPNTTVETTKEAYGKLLKLNLCRMNIYNYENVNKKQLFWSSNETKYIKTKKFLWLLFLLPAVIKDRTVKSD